MVCCTIRDLTLFGMYVGKPMKTEEVEQVQVLVREIIKHACDIQKKVCVCRPVVVLCTRLTYYLPCRC